MSIWRRALIVSLFIIALTGCFGGGDDVVEVPELPADLFEVFEAGDFVVNFPVGWTVQRDFAGTVAKTTEVAFVSNIKEVFFTPVVTVASQEVGTGVTSRDLAVTVSNQNEQVLLDYNELNQSIVAAADGDTILMNFSGRTAPADNIVEYFQVYHVSGTKGYVVTGAHDPNGEPTQWNQVQDTVLSFRLR